MSYATVRALGALLMVICALSSAEVNAQQLGANPVSIVLPYTPGGDMDRIGRLLAEKLTPQLGTTVIFENFGGAGGNIGTARVFNASPDGHTILFGATAQVLTNKLLYSKMTFDPDRLSPVVLVSSNAMVLVANPKFEANDVRELIVLAKKRPGALNYVSGGVGTSSHLAMELFSSAAGVKMLHVPYKSSSVAVNDVVAGNADLGFFSTGIVTPYINSGRLKVLGVGGTTPFPQFPSAKPISDALPGVVVGNSWHALMAPPGTALPIRRKLADAVTEIIKSPDVVQAMRNIDFVPIGGTPEELEEFVSKERDRWEKLIRDNNIRIE